MGMDDVERARPRGDLLPGIGGVPQLGGLVGRPHGLLEAPLQLPRGLRVARGERGDVVAEARQVLGELGDHQLGPTIGSRRDRNST